MQKSSILCPVDFSKASRRAVEAALDICTPDGTITLLHVVDLALVRFAAEFTGREEHECLGELKSAAADRLALLISARAAEVEPRLRSLVAVGIPFLEIVKTAESEGVELLVMGKFGSRGKVEKVLYGTTAEKVLRWAEMPVLVV